MSTELDHAREMAKRIARRVSGSTGAAEHRTQPRAEVSAELAAVRAGLNELQRKISQLEKVVSSNAIDVPVSSNLSSDLSSDFSNRPRPPYSQGQQSPAPSTHSPWLGGINASYAHPSQEQFGVEEATVTELVDFFEKEKLCSVEPGGKPCDHCAMCSSRGF